MYVQLALVVDAERLILRFKPYRDAFVVEHALVGLAHGDDLRHRLAGGDVDAAAAGGDAVHQHLQSLLVESLRYIQDVGEVHRLVGCRAVGQVQRELPRAAGGDVGQRGARRPYLTVGADAYDGLLHLLCAVGDDVLLLRLVVFGQHFTLIGVVALAAAQHEDVAPATRRLVDVDAEVGAGIAVVQLIVKLDVMMLVVQRVASYTAAHVSNFRLVNQIGSK